MENANRKKLLELDKKKYIKRLIMENYFNQKKNYG